MANTAQVVEFLSKHQPFSLVTGEMDQVSLIDIVDKTATALSVETVDMLVINELNQAAVEQVFEFCTTKPFGSMKFVVINLQEATPKAQRALLSILESSNSYLKMVLFSNNSALPGIVSRCQEFRLNDRHLPSESSKTRVLKALASTSLGERALLEATVKEWTNEDTLVLKDWACERLSGRYVAFEEVEVENIGLSKEFAQSLLEALGTLKSVEPRKAIMSVMLAYIIASKGAP
jgi:hypothetical protein